MTARNFIHKYVPKHVVQKPCVLAQIFTPSIDSWVADTRSDHHAIPASHMSTFERAELTTNGPPIKLNTANGIISDKCATSSAVSELGLAIKAKVSDSIPRVLSVAQLVQHWSTVSSGGPEGATLTHGGKAYSSRSTAECAIDRVASNS